MGSGSRVCRARRLPSAPAPATHTFPLGTWPCRVATVSSPDALSDWQRESARVQRSGLRPAKPYRWGPAASPMQTRPRSDVHAPPAGIVATSASQRGSWTHGAVLALYAPDSRAHRRCRARWSGRGDSKRLWCAGAASAPEACCCTPPLETEWTAHRYGKSCDRFSPKVRNRA